MRSWVFAALFLAVPAFAQKAPFTACLKAYSDGETRRQLQECGKMASALSDGRCVSGPEVFHQHGCGVYDVALLGTVEVPESGEGPLRICLKAYSDAETRAALPRCEALARALNQVDRGLRFEAACASGRDAFYVHGCGIYDVALHGKVSPR